MPSLHISVLKLTFWSLCAMEYHCGRMGALKGTWGLFLQCVWGALWRSQSVHDGEGVRRSPVATGGFCTPCCYPSPHGRQWLCELSEELHPDISALHEGSPLQTRSLDLLAWLWRMVACGVRNGGGGGSFYIFSLPLWKCHWSLSYTSRTPIYLESHLVCDTNTIYNIILCNTIKTCHRYSIMYEKLALMHN